MKNILIANEQGSKIAAEEGSLSLDQQTCNRCHALNRKITEVNQDDKITDFIYLLKANHSELSIVVLQRHPGLQIVSYRLKKKNHCLVQILAKITL